MGELLSAISSVKLRNFSLKNLRLHRNIGCPATQYFHFREPSTFRFSGYRGKINSGKTAGTRSDFPLFTDLISRNI
jgi:hypothetical protein